MALLLLAAAYACWAFAGVYAELIARERERIQALADRSLKAHGARLRARIHERCQLRVRS